MREAYRPSLRSRFHQDAGEYEGRVVFRFGKLKKVKHPGVRLLMPISDRMTKVHLRTVTMPVPSRSIIIRDNVSIEIAAAAYFHVNDPVKSVVAIENVNEAVNQIAQATARNVVVQPSLDELRRQVESINEKTRLCSKPRQNRGEPRSPS